jgi:hypothetical protein
MIWDYFDIEAFDAEFTRKRAAMTPAEREQMLRDLRPHETCQWCGGQLYACNRWKPTGRPRKYCRYACRDQARDHRYRRGMPWGWRSTELRQVKRAQSSNIAN